jgi:hypothetical protein
MRVEEPVLPPEGKRDDPVYVRVIVESGIRIVGTDGRQCYLATRSNAT